MEQIDYSILFRWFVGLSMDAPVGDHSAFTKNRNRLMGSDIAGRLFSIGGGEGTNETILVG